MVVSPIIEQLEFRRAKWLELIVAQIKHHGVVSHLAVEELEVWDRRIEKELRQFVCPPEAEILNDD